jgi:hypothetical protein
MPVLIVFETITKVICASLEIASHIYVCFSSWLVIIITMFCLAYFYVVCLCAICGTYFNAPSVQMESKDKPK